MSMTVEQFNEFAKNLPSDVDRRKLARAMNVELPVEVKPLSEQLNGVKLVKHTPKVSKRNANPVENTYVEVPSMVLDQTSGTRSFWVNARAARQIAQKILEVCDKENL